MGKLESNQFQSTKSLCNEFAVTRTFGQEGIISIYTDVTRIVLCYSIVICRHRPGHSLGQNIKLHEMKNKKKFHGF